MCGARLCCDTPVPESGALTDDQLRSRIFDELRFEPSVNAARIGVTVSGAIVTLVGSVHTYAEKLEALEAARRVKGVRAVADHLDVSTFFDHVTTDEEIAERAAAILEWDATLPPGAVTVTVRGGWLHLDGRVDWQFQRKSAEENIRKLEGLRGVVNLIEVGPRLPKAANDSHRPVPGGPRHGPRRC